MGHAHSHDGHGHGPTPERALWVAIGLNAAFLVLELTVGLWTGSLALLSDAGHMVSDVGALIVALLAARLARHKPSADYTFGLRRAPVLGGLINAIGLVVIVVMIAVEALARLDAPPELEMLPVLWTGVAGLGVNLGSAWYLARSRDSSVNTRGAMVHLLADALGSVAAIISALAVGLADLPVADPIASLVIAGLIGVGSWPLLRDTVAILLQRAPSGVDTRAALTLIEEHPGVESVEDFHLWGLDAGQPVLTAVLRVEVQAVEDANALADDLREALRARFDVHHVTLELRRKDAPEVAGHC